MAQAVENAGFVQDVVIATTRLLHRAALTERDLKALRRCQQLLRAASPADSGASTAIDEPRLEPTKSASLVRAARTALPRASASFDDALSTIDIVLAQGDLDDHDRDVIAGLRSAFLAIGEANLSSMTTARRSRRDLGLWKPSTTSSPS